MLVHELISRAARLHPQRTALQTGGDRVSYLLLNQLSDKLAELIAANGWRGRHGGLFLENSIEYVVSFFAIAKADGVITPTPTSLPSARLAGDFSFSDVRFVITQPKHLDAVLEAARENSKIEGVIVVERGGRSLRLERLRGSAKSAVIDDNRTPTADDPIAMFSTSGTAAEPKRVILSHRNLLANVASFLSVANLSPANKGLIVLPMTAIGTNTTELLAYLAVGMTTRIYTGVFVLGEFCRTLEEELVQVVNLTPFILNVMLEKRVEVSRRTRCLRKVFFASAPIPPVQFQTLLSAFPHIDFYYGYGQTEASPRCTTLAPDVSRDLLGSSGSPLPGVEIKIVDDEGNPLSQGVRGEILVRGANVMRGYYKRPDLTATAIQDDWLHTGDCGVLDENGYLFISGRKKNIIVTRGISVSPEEIEQEIVAHPAVKESCVTSQDDDRIGERLVAQVVLRRHAGLTDVQLRSFLRVRLDAAKIPTEIVFVSELKRNHHNKLVRA